MEADERLRWLEARISSSLRPRGEELRNFFADEENRAAFLAFCNHSESRRIFIHLTSDEGQIRVDTSPPRSLSDKSLFFLKCSHASKLNRESIGQDVVYSECSRVPLDHLELVMKEVYLPLMSLQSTTQQQRASGDKLLDLMHRLVGAMQVTKGYSQGKVVLPMPSIEVLAETAMNSDRRVAVIHVLESSVVSWMKQVKMALHLDCNSAIKKRHGNYAGPLAELEVWNKRIATLESVRDQMDSVVVLNILHSLEQAHSTYSQAFIHVHRDIGKAIVDTEHCLVYLSTLRPWFLQLQQAYSPDTLLKLFPPLMTTLSLVWQYSGVYCHAPHFQRLLGLVSNQVTLKARDIVGGDILEQPEESLAHLKLALRVCAAFRGCYLDYRERSEVISVKHKERVESMKLQGDTSHDQNRVPQSGGVVLCPWPPRNAPVFGSLSSFMERCNDLFELVQTVQDFRELEAAAYGDSGSCRHGSDPLITDIYSEFTACLQQLTQGAKGLLDLDPDSHFEESFFLFRSTVKSLEEQMVGSLVSAFDSAPSLPASLRVLELFQGVVRRDHIKVKLTDQIENILSTMISDVTSVSELLSMPRPPFLPHTPPVACKLLWLHALKERVCGPMDRVKQLAPEILEGDSGWRLRQAYGRVVNTIDSLSASTMTEWCESVPSGLQKSLRWNILTRDSRDRLAVNFDPTLNEVLSEVRYLRGSPLCLRPPPHLTQLARELDYSELRHRQTSLQVVVQTYNEILEGLSPVERNLFQHKLQQTEQLLCGGLDQLDWTSVTFPDFIAKSRAAVCVDLQSTLNEVHCHMTSVGTCVEAWSRVAGLDVFIAGEERTELKCLESNNRQILESLQSTLPPSVQRISSHIDHTFSCIDEASQESPAWTTYLHHIDTLVRTGLKQMVLNAISSLVQRANHYEQGHPIPPLVTVELELQASDVQFSPPLSSHSAIVSVPEAVHKWIEEYIGLAKLVPRFEGVAGTRSCFEALCGDAELKSAVSKINAHLKTNARHCQSLRKRFTLYSFLWEQDVSATFSEFLRGTAPPHPRRFTRPETVRSRASARAHSGRPRSSTLSQSTLPSSPESNLLGVMGVSDWDFLRPPSSPPEEDESKRPSLDDFDGEIAIFQGVLDRLSNIEDVADVGWVCVDQRPIKQALCSLTSKWKHVYASHLERQVGFVLSSLDQFFAEVEPEVELISGEESDTHAFMRLMNIFNKVNNQQLEMDNKFGAVHRAVLILDKFDCQLSPAIRSKFSAAPQRWSNLKKRVALGKQRVGPRIQAKGDVISQDLTRFREIFANFKASFLSSQCIHHDCSKEEAFGLVAGFTKQLRSLQAQAQDLIELQELLETSVFNFSLLKEFEEELSTLQELWKLSDSIELLHSTWYPQCWSDVDSTQLLVGTEEELDQLSALPRATVADWDLYQHILGHVSTVQANAPVLERLRSPSMRPRHWKQVLKLARSGTSHHLSRGGTFDVSLLEELTFGQFLDMALHEHAAGVDALVDRANKDVAIESLLNTFEEVWLSKHFDLQLHQRVADTGGQEALSELAMERSSATPKSRAPSTRVTSGVRRVGGGAASITLPTTPGHMTVGKVPLLCNTGGIFETLESHQMSLQSLEGTVAAASFADDLQKWHKQLQTIEAVLRVWLKVQLLWTQLEGVYGSTEVSTHLPGHTYTFSTVDSDWRELMVGVARNTAVISLCLKDGLLPSLEKFHSSLVDCQTALVRYVEGQRVKCPWFYFLPLEDILQFMCYGSSLEQFSAQIHRLLPHASALVFNDDLGPPSTGHTPSHAHTHRTHQSKICGVVSTVGEQLNLVQAVSCDGPVDLIISKVMSSISSTLQSQLGNVVGKFITPSPAHKQPIKSLSDLPNLWKTNIVSTQITILVTQISLETTLSKAIENSQKLSEFLSEINTLLNAVSDLIKGSSNVSQVGLPEVLMSAGASQICQDNMESNVALKDSVSNMSAVGSTSNSGVFGKQINNIYGISKYQLVKLQNIQLVLLNYKLKAANFLELGSNSTLNDSFEWQSMVHYEWSPREQKASISILGTRLVYGYQHTGSSSRLLVTPLMERTLYSLLQAVRRGGGAMLTGEEGSGKSSLVRELAVTSGRLLYTVRCSPLTNVAAAIAAVKGMSATGSWLLLQSLDTLTPSILQTVCSLLAGIHRGRVSHSTSIQCMKTTVAIATDPAGACFATMSCSKQQTFPSTLLEYFQTCSVNTPDRMIVLEALFLVNEFNNSLQLAQLLDKVCLSIEELFDDLDCGKSTQNPFNLSLHKLKTIVLLAHKHCKDLVGLGLLATTDGEPTMGNNNLKMPSMVYSEMSLSTQRASLKFRAGSENNDSEPLTRPILEEFSLLLALKDTLLPSVCPESKEYDIIVTLISELLPGFDLIGLLDHEDKVREGLALKAASLSGAVESARESRAASAMQNVLDDNQTSEAGGTLEDQIVSSCQLHQLIPTVPFQTAVSQLVTLVQSNRFTIVSGPSCSGKTSVIQVAADTLSQVPMSGPVSVTTLVTGAMREEQLLGYQDKKKGTWVEGLLPRTLASLRPGTWVVLEGPLSPAQLDSLLACDGGPLHLSNGQCLTVDPSIRFIVEVTSLSSLTPSSVGRIATLDLSAGTVTGSEVINRWLGMQPDSSPFKQSAPALFDKYTPKVLEFIEPALSSYSGGECDIIQRTSSISLVNGVSVCRLQGQELRLSEVHLMQSLCRILECLLTNEAITSELSTECLERGFVYAVIWSFGGFLSAHNKIIFDRWWRETFATPLPEDGLLWDYNLTSDWTRFSTCTVNSVPVTRDNRPSFVPTVQSQSLQHIIGILHKQGFPVLLSGENGTGKTSLLLDQFGEFCNSSDSELLRLYVNQSTSAQSLWEQVVERLEWQWGRRYTPRRVKKLVCFVDDIHNTQCISASEFIRGHISSGGFSDPHTGKTHVISDVSYIVTGHLDNQSGGVVDGRLLKHFNVLHWDGYKSDQVCTIFGSVLESACVGIDSEMIGRLVAMAMQVHRRVEGMFLATPDRLHYVFSMTTIAAVFRHLVSRLETSPGGQCDLLREWVRVGWWEYAATMATEVDRERYWEMVSHALKKFFNQDIKLPELLSESSVRLPAGEVAGARGKLAHQLEEYNMSHPAIHINLYDSTIEEVVHLCEILASPHDMAHTLLLGHTHSEPLVQLASLHTGHTLTQPSQHFSSTLLTTLTPHGISPYSYQLENLRKNLVHIYTTAGVKNEKTVLLFTEEELLHEGFLTFVYQFVKGGAISPMFSKEEESCIVTAVRSDLAQSGLAFTVETAWSFFLRRVCSNVRVVLSLPRLTDSLLSGFSKWRQLLGCLRVCYHLPWERKELVDVAMHHLKDCTFLSDRHSEGLAHLLASVHLHLRKRPDTHTSNTAYQYFTERFVHQLTVTHAAIKTRSNQVAAALATVSTAQAQAVALEERIGKEEVILSEKKGASLKLLVLIGQDTAILKQHSRLLSKQRERISHLKKVIPEFEHACDLSLQDKGDIITSSQQLVLNMDQSGLCELRTILRPPEELEQLLVAVISVIKGPTADITWTKGAKRLMANLDRFCELLMEYGACEDNSDLVLESLEPLMQQPTFSPQAFTQYPGGKAAAQLASWVQGVHSLHSTLQTKIRPLQAKISTMQASLSEYTDRLKGQENKIRVLDERLSGLSVALETASVDKSRQADLVRAMHREWGHTKEFIQTLSGAHTDWLSQSTDVTAALSRAMGACCLSVCLAVYLSPLPPHTQLEAINQQVIPVMRERGIELYWPGADQYLSAFASGNPTENHDNATYLDASTHSVSQVQSYSDLAQAVVSTLAPRSFTDRWISGCGSVSQLLGLCLIQQSWRRWPLVFDPQGLAGRWIRTAVGETLVTLDGDNRCCKFYQSLEGALVSGGCVLIEHFPCTPADPSLHPLLSLRHSWRNGINVVQLCGHRLHVHASFKLYLTTTTPLSSLTSSLRDDVTLISLDVSHPVAVDLLLSTALEELGSQEVIEKAERSCVGVASCKEQLADLEGMLLSQLPTNGKDPVYVVCTERIAATVDKSNQVSSELQSHLSSLHQLFIRRSKLRPLAQHAASAYTLLRKLAESAPRYTQNWTSFTKVFKSSLDGKTDVAVGDAISEAIQMFNESLLQDTFRYLEHHHWTSLVTALSLLSLYRPHPSNTALLADQLDYLQHRQSHLEETDLHSAMDLPTHPLCITVELWALLHKLPLSVTYLNSVLQTTQTHTEFWVSISTSDTCNIGIDNFPWKSTEIDSTCTGIEDYVLLMCISEECCVSSLNALASCLLEAVHVPSLEDVLVEGMVTKKPLMLYYEQESMVSQVNHGNLEAILRKTLKDKSISALKMGSDTEELATNLLTRPSSDCLLLEDIHYSPHHWTKLLPLYTRQAINTGCQLVLTASIDSSNLPHELIQSCQTILLSNMATTTTSSKTIPKRIWMYKALRHEQLLKICLASIPEMLMSKTSQLKEKAKPIIFTLSVLHVAVMKFNFIRASKIPCTFNNLLQCVSTLLTLSADILSCIVLTVRDVYSACVPSSELKRFVAICLSQESCVPGATLVLGEGVEFTVPPQGVDPARYGEHVMDHTQDGDPLIRWTDFCDGIDVLLLPLLDHLPTHLTTAPSTPLTPSHSTPYHTTRSFLATLDYVSENLPACINVGVSGGALVGVVSQLPSTQAYNHFKLERLCSQFNETLIGIRDRDVPALSRYSRVEFDSLPSSLTDTLATLQKGVWPQEWRVALGHDQLSLDDGIQELSAVRERLSSLVN